VRNPVFLFRSVETLTSGIRRRWCANSARKINVFSPIGRNGFPGIRGNSFTRTLTNRGLWFIVFPSKHVYTVYSPPLPHLQNTHAYNCASPVPSGDNWIFRVVFVADLKDLPVAIWARFCFVGRKIDKTSEPAELSRFYVTDCDGTSNGLCS